MNVAIEVVNEAESLLSKLPLKSRRKQPLARQFSAAKTALINSGIDDPLHTEIVQVCELLNTRKRIKAADAKRKRRLQTSRVMYDARLAEMRHPKD